MRWPWLLACALTACADPATQGPREAARTQAIRAAAMSGIGPADMPVLAHVAELRADGGTVERFAQVIDGLPVYHHELRMLVRDDGSLVTSTGKLFSTKTRRSRPHFALDEAAAIRRAVMHTYGIRTVAVGQTRATQVWIPQRDELVAAWVVEAYTSDPRSTNGDLRRTVIAADGRVISDESLVADATYNYRVFAETSGEKHPFDGPIADSTPHPTGVPGAPYPAFVSPNMVTVVEGLNKQLDPWLTTDAPDTSGNNVDAYVDLSAPSGLGSGDFRAAASGNNFDYTYNTLAGPLDSQTQQMASITSLFYVINWLHDFWYDAGFDEAAGNAQTSNYGRGGFDEDVLLAEAQDNAPGGSRNNANMATPDDGMSPRMQVYLWSGKDTRSMTLSPSGRTPAIGGSSFGPKDFTVSGEIIAGIDGGTESTTDGCTALSNNVSGKIVIVDRGNCTFKKKTFNVQTAGGIAVIIANNVASTSPNQLGDDANLPAEPAIPSVSVIQSEGAAIRQDLLAGTVNATISRDVAPELDGALDSTLIAHEFGHYLHHRLTFCANYTCRALSEGWGDFTALMLLARPGDDLMGAYPFSVYAVMGYAGDPAYFGIRRAPYSADFGKNALTYRHMANGEPLPTSHPIQPSNDNAEVHNAGEVWAQALWEGYVALQKAGPGSFVDIREKMARYVVAGLSLTPLEANPMEARDAILAAALAASPSDHQTLIEAFARRGFGSCAVAPVDKTTDFVGLVESYTIAGNPKLANHAVADACDGDGILDTGESAHVRLRVVNQGHAPLTNVSFTISSQVAGLSVISPPTQLAVLEPFKATDLEFDIELESGLTDAIAGDLSLEVNATGGCEQVVKIPFATRLNVDDVAQSSTTDTFDAMDSQWSPWTIAWSHERLTPLDGYWHGANLATQSDVSLTSPFLIAHATEPLVLTFSHRYQFELGGADNVAWDGGVVELSTDNGVTWQDVATLTSEPGYSGTVGEESNNVLSGRLAFVGTSPAWPERETVTIDLGTELAGQTFQIRFRIGTDGGTGAEGWDIDDVGFSGIVGKPFPSEVADTGNCSGVEPDDPIISGGGGCCDTGGAGSTSSAFAMFVLGLLLRRRRRR